VMIGRAAPSTAGFTLDADAAGEIGRKFSKFDSLTRIPPKPGLGVTTRANLDLRRRDCNFVKQWYFFFNESYVDAELCWSGRAGLYFFTPTLFCRPTFCSKLHLQCASEDPTNFKRREYLFNVNWLVPLWQ
jgi:hypothetical protein